MVSAAVSSVPKADVKSFVEQVLDKIPQPAIHEAFVTAGASPAEADGFTAALLDRIQQLKTARGAY